jgi:hypothetical protein
MTQDFDAFKRCFQLSHKIVAFYQVAVLEDEDALRAAFDEMSAAFRGMGMTHLVREVISTEFQSHTRFSTTHLFRVMRHGVRVRDPYPVLSDVVLVGADWRITSADYALKGNSEQGRALGAVGLVKRGGRG